MLKFLRDWYKKRELVLSEADEFMESFGNAAYGKARSEARQARNAGDWKRDKFLSRVCKEIAKRTDFDIGLDTATRYIEKQAHYDPGPGLIRTCPHDVTLH